MDAGQAVGRSPHGERGLKYTPQITHGQALRRSPHGERGLKCLVVVGGLLDIGRSPHGERGLKFQLSLGSGRAERSLSSWRAWIEISLMAVCLPL